MIRNINPIDIINKIYKDNLNASAILIEHSTKVAKKSFEIAKNLPELNPDLHFIYEAAMLHDIGIINTNAPSIYCFGSLNYLAHGIEGKKILLTFGLENHGRVCETHIGLGLLKEEIIKKNLPLPQFDMMPQSLEEKIICFADKFFSKGADPEREFSFEEVESKISKYGLRSLNTLYKFAEELRYKY